MFLRVVVGGARDPHVRGDDGFTLATELLRERGLEHFEVETEQVHHDAERGGVLRQAVLAVSGHFEDRHAAQLDPIGRVSGRDGVRVVDRAPPGSEVAQVPGHGVLVQGQQKVEPVAVRADFAVADPHREEDVAAPDDRLIGVVGVEVQPATDERAGEDVAGSGDALPGGASDGDGEVETLIHGCDGGRAAALSRTGGPENGGGSNCGSTRGALPATGERLNARMRRRPGA